MPRKCRRRRTPSMSSYVSSFGNASRQRSSAVSNAVIWDPVSLRAEKVAEWESETGEEFAAFKRVRLGQDALRHVAAEDRHRSLYRADQPDEPGAALQVERNLPPQLVRRVGGRHDLNREIGREV